MRRHVAAVPLRFGTGDGWRVHTPDFLAVTCGGGLVVDVRPTGRIGADDRVCFAASAEAAVACGWRYLVATGWRQPALSTVDALSAQRRGLTDPLEHVSGWLGFAGAAVEAPGRRTRR